MRTLDLGQRRRVQVNHLHDHAMGGEVMDPFAAAAALGIFVNGEGWHRRRPGECQ